MRKEILYKLLEILILFIFSILAKSYNIFPFFLALILYKILSLTIMSIDYKDIYIKYKGYTSFIFKLLMLKLSFYIAIFMIIMIILSKLLNLVYNINNLSIIFLLMVLNVFADGGTIIIKEYYGYKKIGKKIMDIYKILSYSLLIIISIIVFKVIKNIDYIYLLFIPKIISYILILILFLLYSYKKRSKSIDIKIKISYKNIGLIAIYGYIYLSILILSIILNNKFGIDMDKITSKITNIYFYDLFLIIYIIDIINIIKNKETNYIKGLKEYIDVNINLTALFSIVGGVIIYLVYNRYDNILFVVLMILFINIYKYICKYKYHKNYLYFAILSGLTIKCIISYPLIISFGRIGYNTFNSEIISITIGIFISIMILFSYIIKKETISLSKVTEFIVNKVNKGIIISIFLLITSIFIPLTISKRVYAPLILLIYFIISYIIDKTLKKLFSEEGK